MPARVGIEMLDALRPNLRVLIEERARSLPDLRYCDLRIEVREGKGASHVYNGVHPFWECVL